MVLAVVGFAVGMALGIAVDWKARRERDQRIKELEQKIDSLTEPAPVRVCEGALRGCEINK